MTEDAQVRHRRRRLVWLGLAAVAVLLAILVAAPLVSLNRYKSRITHLMSASLGRPVRLSSVELRMLPRPGFVLSDLTVEEDAAYGAEPVLHASTVTASIRLLSLLTGQLQISRISVDDATLNLVRAGAGRWNLDPLFRTAAKAGAGGAAGAGGQHHAVPLPYLEATNSRINIKSGTEKLPYSLVDTDVSFWEEEPGEWRIRLRGQPARTDVIVQGADTGTVRLEGSIHRAAQLRQMPVHLDLDWRDAQLGQLARLVIGSDPGWRGDLTAELHLDGTPEAAQIKTRLRAAGVHRAEFAPAAPMDFDANCGFVYHYSTHAVDGLVCDSPLGDGQIRLSGEMPAGGAQRKFSVEMNRIPVAAGLDALRTVRSGFGPGLEAGGSISGKINYAEGAPEKVGPHRAEQSGSGHAGVPHGGKGRLAAMHALPAGPLTGSFTVEGFRLSGDGLRDPVLIPKLTLEPATAPQQEKPTSGAQPVTDTPALAATGSVPAGAVVPLTVTMRLDLSGYHVMVHGQASVARAKELARLAGMQDAGTLDALAGDAVTVDLNADGPWMVGARIPIAGVVTALNMPGAAGSALDGSAPTGSALAGSGLGGSGLGGPVTADRLAGTVTLHNANWKADYLANHVEIQQATLHFDNFGTGDNSGFRWDPVIFSYGPVKGTASFTLPAGCAAGQPCPTRFAVHFGALDAAALQAAILGAHQKGTLLSELIQRLSPSSPAPSWPELEGTVKADSLVLGPAQLEQPSATLHILNTGAEITAFDAGILGGRVRGAGTVNTGNAKPTRPEYALTETFEKLDPVAVGELLGQQWSGGDLNADGKIELTGFTGDDLASSAKGTLHFEWRRGTMQRGTGMQDDSAARFGRWSGTAEIAGGKIALTENQMLVGGRTRKVEGSVQLEVPAKFTFAAPKDKQAKHSAGSR
jgi:hypothetical protein